MDSEGFLPPSPKNLAKNGFRPRKGIIFRRVSCSGFIFKILVSSVVKHI